MNIITSLLLGIVQGLTEFLPISSSGHLVLFQHILGFSEPELLIDIALHFGTLLAVCIYFRSDLMNMFRETYKFAGDIRSGRGRFGEISGNRNLMLTVWVIVGTIPTGIIGLAFRSAFERLFADVNRVGYMLLITGILLMVAKFIPESYSRRKSIGLLSALVVGTVQGLAIIPGISRSGMTIVFGMLLGMNRELSARFSFLLSIPAIMGALILQINSEGFVGIDLLPILVGFLSSAFVGLVALKVLMNMVKKGSLSLFAPYCWVLGVAIIIFS